MLALFGQVQQALAIPLGHGFADVHALINPVGSKDLMDGQLDFTDITPQLSPLIHKQIVQKLNLGEAWCAAQTGKDLDLLRANGFLTQHFYKGQLEQITLAIPTIDSLPISHQTNLLQRFFHRYFGHPFAKIVRSVSYTKKEYEASIANLSAAKKAILNTDEAFLRAAEEIMFKPAIHEIYLKPEIQDRVDEFLATEEGGGNT